MGTDLLGNWDVLLARMVWSWVGHVLRMPSSSLVRSILLDLKSTASIAFGLRRCRPGPNTSGHRNVLRFMHHQGIPLEAARDRNHWQGLESAWLIHHGLTLPDSPAQVFAVNADQHFWD